MKYRILRCVMNVFIIVCRVLPYKGRELLGRFIGWLGYRLTGDRRKVARKNLAESFPEMDDKEIESNVKKMFTHLGFTLIEFFRNYKLAEDDINKYVEFENREYLDRAFERGNGVIIYTAHFGNWEWLGTIIAAMDYPITAIARRQKNIINDKIEKIRKSAGGKVIYQKEGTIRESFRCLKRGECLYVIGDQEARSRGWKINFLGRPASTFNGAVKLAARTGAAILPVYTIRQSLERHKLLIKKPVYVDSDASEQEQREILQELTNISEEVIKDHIPQWMWLHRRWKTY